MPFARYAKLHPSAYGDLAIRRALLTASTRHRARQDARPKGPSANRRASVWKSTEYAASDRESTVPPAISKEARSPASKNRIPSQWHAYRDVLASCNKPRVPPRALRVSSVADTLHVVIGYLVIGHYARALGHHGGMSVTRMGC